MLLKIALRGLSLLTAEPIRSGARLRFTALRIFAALLLSVTALWSASSHLLLSKRGDSIVEHIGDFTWNARVFRSGHLPLWNAYLYSGVDQPALAQTAVYYPPNIVLYGIFPPVVAFNLSLVFHLLLAAFFMRRYLQAVSLSAHAVALGALTFSCCGFALAHKGIVPMFNAAVWIPALFYCAERWRVTGTWKYPFWGGACLALQLFAGWPQFVLFSGLYLVLYVLFATSGTANKPRFLAGVALIFAFSAALGLAQILPTLELKRVSNLTAMPYWFYASNSYPPRLLFLLIFPYLLGADFASAFAPYSWGPREFAISTIYVGVLPLMLATAALPLWTRSRWVRFASTMIGLSAYLAFGTYTHYGRQLYHVPVYNYFRDHYVHFEFFAFGVAILAAVALSSLEMEQLPSRTRRLAGILIPVLFAGLSAAIVLRASWLLQSLQLQGAWRTALARATSLQSPALQLALAFIALSIVAFYLLTRYPQRHGIAVAAVILVACDLGIFGVMAERMPTRFEPTGAEQSILTVLHDGTVQQNLRVFSLLLDTNFLRPNENELQPYADILGFGSIVPQPYGELLSLDAAGRTLQWRELLANQRILSLLNVRYILVNQAQLEQLKPIFGTFAAASSSAVQAPAQPVAESNLVSAADWTHIGSVSSMGDVNAFRSSIGDVHGVTQDHLHLEKNSLYQLTFDFRADSGSASDLSIKLGPPGDPKFFGVAPFLMGSTYRTYTVLYLTGHEDEDAVLQFITASRAMLYVTNIRLQRVGSLPLSNQYRLALQAGDFSVIENLGYLPRAFFVSGLHPIRTYAEARSALWREVDPLDLRTEAVVQDLPLASLSKLGPGQIESLTYAPNEANLRVRCTGTCFLVLTDAQYPGWKAQTDGNNTALYVTDGVVYGLLIPDGTHDVTLRYVPTIHIVGLLVSFLSLAALLAVTFIPSLRLGRLEHRDKS